MNIKMPKNKTGLKILALCAIVGIALLIKYQPYRRVVVNVSKGTVNRDVGILAEDTALEEEAWALWQQRSKRDISRELLPYLRKDNFEVKRFAVRALAKLESPLGEQPIEGSRTTATSKDTRPIPAITLQLALARIRSRNLSGQERLEAICQAGGVTWQDLVEKSPIVNSRNRFYGGSDTTEYQIIDEMVDVLYTMARHSKNIDGLAGDLTLTPVQEIRLKGARLSEEQEAELILDELNKMKVRTKDSQLLGEYLYILGQPAVEPVIKRMEDMKAHPNNYDEMMGFPDMFCAAALLRDRRALPLLKHFEKYPHATVSHKADTFRIQLEQNLQRKNARIPSAF